MVFESQSDYSTVQCLQGHSGEIPLENFQIAARGGTVGIVQECLFSTTVNYSKSYHKT